MFMDTIDRPAVEAILDYLEASDAPMRVAQLRVLGRAMARVPVEATAFAQRQRRNMVNLAAFYHGPSNRSVGRPGSWISLPPCTRETPALM